MDQPDTDTIGYKAVEILKGAEFSRIMSTHTRK